MPENTIYVGRPSKWENIFIVDENTSAKEAVLLFAGNIKSKQVPNIKKELRGRNLARWCKIGVPCHADVLLEIANG